MSEHGTPVRLRLARIRPALALVAALGALCAEAQAADADATSACATPVGRIVSVQGTVDVQRAGQQSWIAVKRLDTPLCQGDFIRTGSASRAALVVLPEKFIRVDQSSTLSISVKDDETVVELTQGGSGYFITRFPRKFKVNTRYLNAAVEGTEFMVSMSGEAAAVSVFEGKVSAESPANAGERVMLKSGETASAGAAEPPTVKVTVKPLDAVQWVLYYPPLEVAGADAGPDQSCDQAGANEKSRCLTIRAEQRLRVGRVDEAQSDIEGSLTLLPNNSDADALLSIVSLVKNDKARALAMAGKATQTSPNSPHAWIALSYAQQASFALEDALASAERAAAINPASATAQTRVAELLLSLGRVRSAERTAQAAVDANPDASRARTILGFAHLTQIDTKRARADFAAAIERDSSDPLPRLGLGLTIIRGGDLKAGREQIEIAVMLDPTSSLMRSYVGKAYYEEDTKERNQLASSQFGLARQLDPKDPTPWYYDAILKDSQNRPVEALADLGRSIELNDNRAIYRSQLLLDQDRAAREVSVARSYDQLGLNERAAVEASSSLSTSPSNASAHRFLSDAYQGLSRHEISQSSEVLQTQLLQPQSLTPVLPSSAFTGLNIAPTALTGSSRLDQNDALLERNGLQVIASGFGGNQETLGDQLVVSGLAGPVSGSLGQFHYQTEGWRQNADLQHDLYDGFIQLEASPEISLQAEFRRRDTQNGDIAQNFDPNNFFPNNRNKERLDTARVGARASLAPGATLIGSFAHVEDTIDSDQFIPGGLEVTQSSLQRGYLGEVQSLLEGSLGTAVLGAGNYEVSEDTAVQLIPFPGFVIPGPSGNFNRRQSNGYGYFNFPFPKPAIWTLGMSYDDVSDEQSQFHSTGWNPKIGLELQVSPFAKVRMAGFQTMKPALVASQTIEPTQVAGFDQFYDDPNGTKARRAGVGVDLNTGSRVFFGGEVTRRALQVPLLVGTTTFESELEDRTEHEHRAYVSWMITDRWVASTGVRYDEFERNPIVVSQTPLSVRTRSIPLSLRYFDPRGFSAYATATRLIQDVDRDDATLAPGFGEGHAHFTLVDLGIAYRHPNRHFAVSLECLNCTDQQFTYQDDSFRTPTPETSTISIVPVRTLFLKATLKF